MTDLKITKAELQDFDTIHEIILDSASAYRGIIPADRWRDPYMSKGELQQEIGEGVEFWKCTENNTILGVMGIQVKEGVTLIRHAYVRTQERQKGVGGKLLEHFCAIAATPILIGTWAQASWAIKFYQKHGFRLLPEEEKNSLLKKYWSIPTRQMETSVVLANDRWESLAPTAAGSGY